MTDMEKVFGCVHPSGARSSVHSPPGSDGPYRWSAVTPMGQMAGSGVDADLDAARDWSLWLGEMWH